MLWSVERCLTTLIVTFVLSLLVAILMAVRLPDVMHSITAQVSLWGNHRAMMTRSLYGALEAALLLAQPLLSPSCRSCLWLHSWLSGYLMSRSQLLHVLSF